MREEKLNISAEGMSEQDKNHYLAMVANLYYNLDMTQSEIASRLFTSRSKISRMLKEARELGIVTIEIKEPWGRNVELEKYILGKYPVREVRVIQVRTEEGEEASKKMTEAAGFYIDSMIKPNMVIGLSWGRTLYRIINAIAANNRKNIPITAVPIMGAATINTPERDAQTLAKNLAGAYGGSYQNIYAPLYLKSTELRNELIQEKNIGEVLNLARNADMIITSCGSIKDRSWNNYISDKTIDLLEKKGAIGHIAGHFFSGDGKQLPGNLQDRMIGLSLEDIRSCKETVCVAFGEVKGEAVAGALCADLIDTLIIDESCASRMAELETI